MSKQQQHSYSYDNDYLQNKQIIEETRSIARETLTSLQSQCESLEHSKRCSEETLQMTMTSHRVLRGMSSWKGWFYNQIQTLTAFSSTHLDSSSNSGNKFSPSVSQAVEAVNAFHCHLELYDQQLKTQKVDLDAKKERALCLETCRELKYKANMTVGKITVVADSSNEKTDKEIKEWLQNQMTILNAKLQQFESSHSEALSVQKTIVFTSNSDGKSQSEKEKTVLTSIQHQDEYLENVAPCINELKSIGNLLNKSIEHQNHLVNEIEKNTEESDDKMRQVNRMAGRLNDRKAFKKKPPSFQGIVFIKYMPTKQYLSIINGDLALLDKICGTSSLFEMYENQGGATGFKNMATKKWLGQSLFGSIGCFGSSFGVREEWEIDSKALRKTYLLCASAHWGQGGWLVYAQNKFVTVGDDIDTKRNALLWCIDTVENTDTFL